jgi:BCD family chlorophyll transporter-like MFS transporter
MNPAARLSWFGILRLGLVQMSLGGIAVLSLSTLNRIMVVELALPAVLPGFLVGLHYAVQILRPRWGYGSDTGGLRTPWIIGGMAVLALGGAGAAAATALMATATAAGIFAAVLAYLAIGLGAGAAGTSLLALLAKEAGPRAPVAGPVVWIMMILGFAVSAGLAGRFLDPFSTTRLVEVGATVSAIAFTIALLAVWGVESPPDTREKAEIGEGRKTPFFDALRSVWAEPQTRRLSIFIFLSMLAFSGQELLLEPFGGTVFKLTPGQSAQLSGLLHAGAFTGMITGLVAAAFASRAGLSSLGPVISAGCAGSAFGLLSLVYGGILGPDWPVRVSVAGLGFANGVYAIASIAVMMTIAGAAKRTSTGTHLGIWGAAQAIASGLGGLLGTMSADAVRLISGSPYIAYLSIFTVEAALFLLAAWLAIGIGKLPQQSEARITTASTAPAPAAAP